MPGHNVGRKEGKFQLFVYLNSLYFILKCFISRFDKPKSSCCEYWQIYVATRGAPEFLRINPFLGRCYGIRPSAQLCKTNNCERKLNHAWSVVPTIMRSRFSGGVRTEAQQHCSHKRQFCSLFPCCRHGGAAKVNWPSAILTLNSLTSCSLLTKTSMTYQYFL